MLNNTSRRQSSRNTIFLESRYERQKMAAHTRSTSRPRIATPLQQPSNRGIQSGHSSRLQSHGTSSVVPSNKELPAKLEQSEGESREECIKLFCTTQSMNTEELCRWFDVQSPETQSKVKYLLEKHKRADYNKLMARSKTNRK